MSVVNLFDEFPRLESDRLILREWTAADAPALGAIVRDPEIYRYLPTFLYEQSIPDAGEMIARARAECFDTKQSVLFGICLKSAPDTVIGIAEIYNYEPQKEKASVGYRLLPAFWGQGIASETTALLVKYLIERTDVRKITAHVMAENAASARVLEKNGFVLRWTGLREDWGRGAPVLINKFMYKLLPEHKNVFRI
ncbi:MAG: GNAT family N-acetyltransferase [Clostridia bacterium]|nr:GNAT family N-acetyltransferase [Clostridia bacterium]